MSKVFRRQKGVDRPSVSLIDVATHFTTQFAIVFTTNFTTIFPKQVLSAHFTNNFANEQIKKGNAIKLREGVVVTPALIEHATKKKKK